jgi:alkanesulfonate monooxygenase SsuD/methylene tetrahydromethanopterin reductase-like flavin-dependent oxidoreductase (luciferase family)
MSPRFGVNLNNREPLIASTYTLQDLLDLSSVVEDLGFDSVWVGDSLFSKPRYDPIVLLAAISQRTSRVRLGTACLVTGTRNPLYLAMEWSTLDHLSGGRTILGACMGNPEEGVRREYSALGLDFEKRGEIFEEGIEVIRELWTTGAVTYHGRHYQYEEISFFSGTELKPLMPLQDRVPVWIVSNPRLVAGKSTEEAMSRVVDRASRRIARLADGWMTCCRAQHPEEFQEQYMHVMDALRSRGKSADGFVAAYQVTMNIGESREKARADLESYIKQYYPELSQSMAVEEWGPVGTPDDIAGWISTFAGAGVNYFICRFASLDQFGQVKRFAEEVLPAFAIR